MVKLDDFLEALKKYKANNESLDFGDFKEFALYELVECLKRGNLEKGKFYQEIYNILKEN